MYDRSAVRAAVAGMETSVAGARRLRRAVGEGRDEGGGRGGGNGQWICLLSNAASTLMRCDVWLMLLSMFVGLLGTDVSELEMWT